MTEPVEQIAKALNRLGVAPGQTIFVHSSLRSFGWVEGGANTVIDALIKAVGPSGNVMMPTLTGSAELSPQNPPFFDVRNTPCWTGIIPETFRQRLEAHRSLHPTHSVACIGPDTARLLDRHHNCPTPCGRRSPYFRLAASNGLIVLLGVDLESVTLFHTVEELAHVPYHLQPKPVSATIIGYRGKAIKRTLYIHKYGDVRNFSIMEPIMLKAGVLRTGKILESAARIINAHILLDLSLARLKRNPLFLLRYKRGKK